MVPFVEGSVTSDEDTELEVESGRAVEDDPLRHAVHVALALYLTPVVALVCLIGGVSILFGKANKIAERLVFRPPQRDGDGPLSTARPGGKETGTRFRDDRERTRIGH